MEYTLLYFRLKSEIEAKACPVHNIKPLAKLENDHITLRCCCDMFTSQCMAELDKKLNTNNPVLSIIDAWERDLFYNELQAG